MDYPPSPSVDGVSLPCLPPRARTPPTPTSAVDSAASSPSAPAKRTGTHLDCEITHTTKRARGIEETTIASQEMFGFSLFSDTGPTPTSFADLPPLDLTLSLTDSGTALLDFSALGLGTGSLPLLDESSWQLLTGGFDLTTPLELTLDGLEQPIQQAKGHGQQGTQLAVSSVVPPTQTEKRKCPRCAVNLKPTYINLEEQILLCRKCDFPLGADDDPLEYIIPCPGSKG